LSEARQLTGALGNELASLLRRGKLDGEDPGRRGNGGSNEAHGRQSIELLLDGPTSAVPKAGTIVRIPMPLRLRESVREH
jgi:hypothetical protein